MARLPNYAKTLIVREDLHHVSGMKVRMDFTTKWCGRAIGTWTRIDVKSRGQGHGFGNLSAVGSKSETDAGREEPDTARTMFS